MFQALKPLLEQCKALDIKMMADGDDRLVLILLPTPKDGQTDAGLRQPIKLEGSWAEFEHGFAEHMRAFACERLSLLDSVALAQAAMEAARTNAQHRTVAAVHGAKPQPAANKPAATPAPRPGADAGDDEDVLEGSDANDAAGAGTPPAAAADPAAAAPPDDPNLDLFSV